MPPTSIAAALFKVFTLPTHSHSSPRPHRRFVYRRTPHKHHDCLWKKAAPTTVSTATTKSTSTDCAIKARGFRPLVKDGVFGGPSGIFAKAETKFWVGPWMMIGSGTVRSLAGKRDLRRMPRKLAAGDSANGISHRLEENGDVGEPGSLIQDQQSKLLTIPTVLTLGRVAAVPLLIMTFYMDGRWATTATTSIFIVASVTDWLDGYLARKMRLGSTFGAFLDPVADKLMVAAALVLLCTKPLEVALFSHAPWLITLPSIAIIGREITMSAVREWAASQNSGVLEAVAVNNLGKWKTATQMTALTILLASRDSSLAGQGVLIAAGLTLLNISAALAVWSLAVYIRKIWRVLLK